MAKKKLKKLSRDDLLRVIEQAAKTGATRLELGNRGITELPDEIRQLVNLQILELEGNRLTALPESIRRLVNLRVLSVQGNGLTTLPQVVCDLTHLTSLWLGDNCLTELPSTIVQLTNLRYLELDNNRLTSLPPSIGQLTKLAHLFASGNALTALPPSFARLTELGEVFLFGNPLNPAIQSAYDAGIDALKAYLLSLEEPAKRELLHEAKLVLVGEGGVGKTSLLKALTGVEPRKDEPTTHGVSINIQAMHVAHPEKPDVKIQLNAWDFGGQEVYRATHQFFFSRRSVYLVVWEPRMGVQQCQVEDWLKLIRLRVGSDASVIIISTHCSTGERIARIDKPVFQRDFGSMIAGFHEVDSLVDHPATGEKVGIAKLKEMIAAVAGKLEQMGMEFNRDWREARDELLTRSETRVSYRTFRAVCTKHGLKRAATRTLAHLMHDLGYIVYYGSDERLKNDVVLQPEWLTKAIGFVLEDRKTQEMEGLLPDSRLVEVWHDHCFEKEPRYDPELYPFFLRLMEKYDVSYRLEQGDASLVAQQVPQVRPQLPWLPDQEPAPGRRRMALVCCMEEAPPGLVPWMIVRTHPYSYHRHHWQKGMFLKYKTHGQAMLELREREFHIYAEAVWPEFFVKVLRDTLQKLITDNWPGLKDRYYFAVPCRERDCAGRFNIDALREFLEDGDETIRCQACRTRQNIPELLFGFEEQDIRKQLNRIEQKQAGSESRLASLIMATMQAIASESKDGPRLFTIAPADGNWRKFFTERYRIQLWCEAEGCQHPVLEAGTGIYETKATRDWVKKVAPYANFIAGVLKTLLPMVAPAVNIYFGPKTIDALGIKDHLDLMEKATKKIEGKLTISDPSRLRQRVLTGDERSGVLALHSMLHDLDPNHERLGLTRLPTYTGDYLWLCRKHYEEAQPKIPDRIG